MNPPLRNERKQGCHSPARPGHGPPMGHTILILAGLYPNVNPD